MVDPLRSVDWTIAVPWVRTAIVFNPNMIVLPDVDHCTAAAVSGSIAEGALSGPVI